MKAVLFDVDGTLLNTYEYIASAFEFAVRSIGHSITREEAEVYMRVGKTLREIYAHMLPDEDTNLLAQRHREFQASHSEMVTTFEGVQETIQTLKNSGYRIAAVTNRARSSMVPTLAQTKLLDLFDAVVCPEDTLRTKPDPEHVMTALRSLECSVERSWMIGDTSVDIDAARRAGVRTIGITHSKDERIRASRPLHVVYSLPEILPIVLN